MTTSSFGESETAGAFSQTNKQTKQNKTNKQTRAMSQYQEYQVLMMLNGRHVGVSENKACLQTSHLHRRLNDDKTTGLSGTLFPNEPCSLE
jgi:hypothetical protein